MFGELENARCLLHIKMFPQGRFERILDNYVILQKFVF